MAGRSGSPGARAALLGAIVVLHLTVYRLVNVWNMRRPATDYLSAWTPLDDWIPYLPWTAVLYYLGDLFIILGGGAIVWRLERGFGRALVAYAGMILTGGIVQVLLPIPGPWPADPSALQRFFHALPGVDPYAALPSMHVALATLPAAIAWTSLRSAGVKALLIGTALIVSLSTLTTKEHYVLDAVTGCALGLAAWAYWRMEYGPERKSSS